MEKARYILIASIPLLTFKPIAESNSALSLANLFEKSSIFLALFICPICSTTGLSVRKESDEDTTYVQNCSWRIPAQSASSRRSP